MVNDIIEQKKEGEPNDKVVSFLDSMDPEAKSKLILVEQIAKAGGSGGTKIDKALITAHNFGSMTTDDKVEQMLIAQMMGLHNLTMSALARADQLLGNSNVKLVELGNITLNSASKLTRTYVMQVEALNKYRGKGQQKMTVEHINVNSGGQAIIGNVKSNDKPVTKGGG